MSAKHANVLVQSGSFYSNTSFAFGINRAYVITRARNSALLHSSKRPSCFEQHSEAGVAQLSDLIMRYRPRYNVTLKHGAASSSSHARPSVFPRVTPGNSKSVFAAINPSARESTLPSGSFQFVHPAAVVVVWPVLFAHKEGKEQERMGTAEERKNAGM